MGKKSITRSLSKKWDSVRGNNNSNYKTTRLSSSPSTDKDEDEVAVVSDTSLDDSDSSSGGDEDNAAEKYGYGDAAPDTENTKSSFPKRLSTRHTIRRRSSTRNSIRRRSSICREKPLTLSEDNDDDENLPFHPERAPRRSSIKGTCPTRARARRRASIATCTNNAVSIEEELASGTLQPSQVLEIRVPGRRESIQRRTSITFNEDVKVQKIQAISKVKGAVKQELWFQDSEYTHIKQKIRAVLDKVDAASSGQYYDRNKYCTRGLEKYMECPQKRASKKYQGWDSVLMEQEMQRNLQIYDDEAIGQFYAKTAQENVVEATHRAQLDAEEVAAYYATDTSTVVATIIAAAVSAARTRRRGRRASVA